MSKAPYPWQEKQWQICLQRIREGKLPHAILLYGEDGLGIDEFAVQLQRAILCRDPEERPCGQCSICHLLDTNNHPDCLILQPEDEKAVIKIDEVRGAIQFLQMSSHYRAGKVLMIQHADMMNRAAANSLLKTLEEPPPNVTIILTSCWLFRLLPTIRSRCQILYFGCPDTDVSKRWLSEAMGIDDAAIRTNLSSISMKPLIAYQALSAEAEQHGGQREFHEDLKAIADGSAAVITVAEKWVQSGEVHQWLLNIIGYTARRKLSGDCDLSLSIEKLYVFYDRQVQRYQQRTNNLNPQLMLEAALLEWQAVCK